MLDQLLEKSEDYRRNVAIFSTFICGIAVVAIWLLIAGYDIRQSTLAIINSGNTSSEEFRNSLPSIRQEGDTIVTELSKQNVAASINGAGTEIKEKSLWEKFLGK